MSKDKQSIKNKIIFLGLDVLAVLILFYIFLWIHIPTVPKNLDGFWIFTYSQYKSLILILLSWLLISQQVRFYTATIHFTTRFKKVCYQLFLFAIVLFAVSGIKTENLYSNEESAYFIGILSVYLLMSRSISWALNSKSKIKQFQFIVVGENKNTESFIKLMAEKDHKSHLISHFVESPTTGSQQKFDLNNFIKSLNTSNIDVVYISMFTDASVEDLKEIIRICEKKYIPIEFIPQSYIGEFESFDIKYYDTFPIFTFSQFPLDNIWNQTYKRLFDILFSFFIIVFILSWLYPIISLVIILDSGFPVLYKQTRNGLHGNFFKCLKFRSMRPSKDNDKKATVKGDSRITRVGKFLRKSSIDELPQFFNVLKGDMSVVGPRPHMVTQDEYYTDIINKYTLRHYVKPGITGLAQVRGYRGEVNSNEDMELRIRADIFYVKNWSFWLDLGIIFKTAIKMLKGDEIAI